MGQHGVGVRGINISYKCQGSRSRRPPQGANQTHSAHPPAARPRARGVRGGGRPAAAAAPPPRGGYGCVCVLPWSQYDTTLHGNRLPVSPHAAQGRGPASGTSSWAAARQPWLSMAKCCTAKIKVKNTSKPTRIGPTVHEAARSGDFRIPCGRNYGLVNQK